jgi:tetratricopeptide (TPR) repeat protein
MSDAKDNVVKFAKPQKSESNGAKKAPKAKSAGAATAGAAAKADQLVARALQLTGAKRIELANQAIALDPSCTDAYMILASDKTFPEEAISLYRQAVKSAEQALPKDWQTRFAGIFWLATETRPVMQAMASLAMALQWLDHFDEALSIYRKLMELNPNDNQGIRYQLAGCLYEAGQDKELEDLFAAHEDDSSAALLYTKALHVFKKNGPNNLSSHMLLKAYKANKHVPLYLSDIIEMPDEAPFSIGFGDESEAIAYTMDHCFMWDDTDGSLRWMADVLEPSLRRDFKNKEMVDEALAELRLDELPLDLD